MVSGSPPSPLRFVKPGASHTFNAEAAAEHYTEAEAAEALAKGVGRVTAEALQRGRPPKNWWEIPRENSRSKERQYGVHPSMKPLKICERLVEVHSNRTETVVIPFGGSGSECVSAAALGRKVIAFETDPEYYQLLLRRMHGHGLLPSHIPPPPPLPPKGTDAAAEAIDAAERTDGADGAADGGAAGGGEGGLGLQRDARYASGYMGVYKMGKRWAAKVMRNGALRSLGTYNTPREAAAAYARECAERGDTERPGGRRVSTGEAAAIGAASGAATGAAALAPADFQWGEATTAIGNLAAGAGILSGYPGGGFAPSQGVFMPATGALLPGALLPGAGALLPGTGGLPRVGSGMQAAAGMLSNVMPVGTGMLGGGVTPGGASPLVGSCVAAAAEAAQAAASAAAAAIAAADYAAGGSAPLLTDAPAAVPAGAAAALNVAGICCASVTMSDYAAKAMQPAAGGPTEMAALAEAAAETAAAEAPAAVAKVAEDAAATVEADGEAEGDEGDKLNWACCDRCEKWRRLPDGAEYESDALPEQWFCYMNPNSKRNSCDKPEEDAEDLFIVESILGEQPCASGGMEYHVKWAGYDESTWEPEDNLIDNEALQRWKALPKAARSARPARATGSGKEDVAMAEGGIQWNAPVTKAAKPPSAKALAKPPAKPPTKAAKSPTKQPKPTKPPPASKAPAAAKQPSTARKAGTMASAAYGTTTGDELVGGSVEIYWPDDDAWYAASVTAHNAVESTHTVVYEEDGVVEELKMVDEAWRVLGEHVGMTCDRSGVCPIVGNLYNLTGADYDLCQAEYDKLDDEEKALYQCIPPPRSSARGRMRGASKSSAPAPDEVGGDAPAKRAKSKAAAAASTHHGNSLADCGTPITQPGPTADDMAERRSERASKAPVQADGTTATSTPPRQVAASPAKRPRLTRGLAEAAEATATRKRPREVVAGAAIST